jgi:hypothetical protein
MTAPAAPNTVNSPNTSSHAGATENPDATGNSAPNGYPASYPAPNGYPGHAYPAARIAPAPAPVAPSAAPLSGMPWFIAGVTLWAIAVAHLMLLPQWLETKTSDGVIGNLTGVLAEIGIGAALLAVGYARRKQSR